MASCDVFIRESLPLGPNDSHQRIEVAVAVPGEDQDELPTEVFKITGRALIDRSVIMSVVLEGDWLPQQEAVAQFGSMVLGARGTVWFEEELGVA